MWTGADAVEAAAWRRPSAMRIVESGAERVGIGIANAINTFDPEEVVIGGGAARAGELLLEPATRVAPATCFLACSATRTRSGWRATGSAPACSARRCWRPTSSPMRQLPTSADGGPAR